MASNLGPQFEQTELPIKPSEDSSVHHRDQLRAQYHLTKDTPLHMRTHFSPGDLYVGHPVPHPGGISTKVTELGASRHDDVLSHPEDRGDYPQAKGQMVMGPPHNPQQFGVLDAHGNVLDRGSISGRWFKKHGPQMSYSNEAFWNKHAKFQSISTSAVLHTGQSVDETGSHSYVTGPLAHDHPHVKVVVQGGNSFIADGHHRLAEARGRGDTHVGAQVLNLDQFTHRPEAYIGKRTPNEDIADHLVKAHNYSPHFLGRKDAFETHAAEHRQGLHDHEHG